MSCRREYEPCDCNSCVDESYMQDMQQQQDTGQSYEQAYLEQQCGSVGHEYAEFSGGVGYCHCGLKTFNGLDLAKEMATRKKCTSKKDTT